MNFEKKKPSSIKKTEGDFNRSNLIAGLTGNKAPKDYVWHHMDDFDPITGECTMQLIRGNVYTRIPGMAHSGSVAQWKNYDIIAENVPEKLFYTQ